MDKKIKKKLEGDIFTSLQSLLSPHNKIVAAKIHKSIKSLSKTLVKKFNKESKKLIKRKAKIALKNKKNNNKKSKRVVKVKSKVK